MIPVVGGALEAQRRFGEIRLLHSPSVGSTKCAVITVYAHRAIAVNMFETAAFRIYRNEVMGDAETVTWDRRREHRLCSILSERSLAGRSWLD